MKKLITTILIIALILPAAALAVDRDKIIGYWYMNADNDYHPEFVSNIGDYDSVLDAYYFTKSGRILLLECAIKDDSATPTFASSGTWEAVENKPDNYTCQLFGMGSCTIVIKDGIMELTNGQRITMKLRPMIIFDPYVDFTY